MSDPKRLVVVGGGIGGYTAAIRGARSGMAVTLIEKGALGGACLNVGCIPTKSLLHDSAAFASLPGYSGFGVDRAALHVDFSAIMGRKSAAVSKLVAGVETLIRRNKIEHISDVASFTGARTLRLAGSGRVVAGDFVVIATGSRPILPPVPGIDLPGVMTSDDAVAMTTLPKTVTIVGGGVIGVEFAQVFANLGTKVTIIELAGRLLGEEDAETADVLAGILKRQGVDIRLNHRLTGITATKGGLAVKAQSQAAGETSTIDSEIVLVAIGRRPDAQALDPGKAGVACTAGAVVVDEWQRASADGVYAVGDVCGGLLLAHKAGAEAETALAHMLGRRGASMSGRAIPRAVYTAPEIACVGLTEAQARERGAIKVGRFPFSANGKAIVGGHAEGFVKVIADDAYEQILGVAMVGPDVTNLLGEATLAVQMELTLEALMETVHAHPTLSEALVEAAHDAHNGGAIHIPPKGRA